MTLLVEIKDSKAGFFMELLKNYPYARTKIITPAKSQLIEEIKEAVEELKLVKTGKLKARPVKELLDEI